MIVTRAPKRRKRLGRLDACVTPAQHDQMRRKMVELEHLDVGQRAGRLEAGNVGNGGVRAEIEDNRAAGEPTDAAVVECDLHLLRADEPPASHDELRAALRVGLQVERDLAFDHILLAPANFAHVRLDVAHQRAELCSVPDNVRDARAPQFVLRGHAGDRRARAADPAALDHGDLLAGLAEAPGELLSALAAAENDDVEVL